MNNVTWQYTEEGSRRGATGAGQKDGWWQKSEVEVKESERKKDHPAIPLQTTDWHVPQIDLYALAALS